MADDICYPDKFLEQSKGRTVIVRLKNDTEFRGDLVSFDSYYNLQLANSKEFVDGQFQGSLGEVVIRCNNVAWIQEVPASV